MTETAWALVGAIVAALLGNAFRRATGHSLGVVPTGLLAAVFAGWFSTFYRPPR